MLTYSYTALWFLYPFFAGYYTNITVNSYNTKRISSLEKSLSEKYVHILGCQKNGAFHIRIQKNRAIHILFVEKRGPVIYLAALTKGAIWHAHPYYATYRKLPPPSPRFTGVYISFLFLCSKTYIVGTRQNRLGEAVLTSTHNLCFSSNMKHIKIFYLKIFIFFFFFFGGKIFCIFE